MNNTAILACQQLTKIFHQGPAEIKVLNGVNFTVNAGERVAIIGNSGSGKTTLLQLLGGLDVSSSGQIQVMGQVLSTMNEQQRGVLRNQHLGFIYQFHHLLPEFTALENVAMPLLIRATVSVQQAQFRAEAVLKQVGLAARRHHKPAELSGGERQRVAVARALVTQPVCILADEPTGNLDGKTADEIYQCMLELSLTQGTALVIVTHDPKIAQRVERVYRMDNGVLTLHS